MTILSPIFGAIALCPAGRASEFTLAEKAFPNTEPIAAGKFQSSWEYLAQLQAMKRRTP